MKINEKRILLVDIIRILFTNKKKLDVFIIK